MIGFLYLVLGFFILTATAWFVSLAVFYPLLWIGKAAARVWGLLPEWVTR